MSLRDVGLQNAGIPIHPIMQQGWPHTRCPHCSYYNNTTCSLPTPPNPTHYSCAMVAATGRPISNAQCAHCDHTLHYLPCYAVAAGGELVAGAPPVLHTHKGHRGVGTGGQGEHGQSAASQEEGDRSSPDSPRILQVGYHEKCCIVNRK